MHKSKSTDCPELSKALPANLQAVQSCQQIFEQINRRCRLVKLSLNKLWGCLQWVDFPSRTNGLSRAVKWALPQKLTAVVQKVTAVVQKVKLTAVVQRWQLLFKFDRCCPNVDRCCPNVDRCCPNVTIGGAQQKNLLPWRENPQRETSRIYDCFYFF